ncbi:unnamed protein product, partial [Prorocentrum cordatum]
MEGAAFAQKVAAYEFGMQNLKLYWVLRHQDDGDGALERIDKAKMDAAGAKLKRTARLLRTYYIVQRSRKPTLNSELPRDVFVDPAQFPDFPKNVRPDSIWLVDSCVSKTQLGPGVIRVTAKQCRLCILDGDAAGTEKNFEKIRLRERPASLGPEGGEAAALAAHKKRKLEEAQKLFFSAKKAQKLFFSAKKEALERGFAAMTRPVPLSFRLNLASPRGREALAALQRLIGDRLEPVAWMPEQSGWRVVPGGSRSGEEEARALVVRAMNRGDFQLQVLDAMLHKAAGLSPPSSLPSGGVVANDTHKDRASKIRQRARFCRRASAALLVTQVDARRFPALHLRSPQGTYPKVKFDRIPEVHHVQLELLRRGLELLKPGGQLCYSTCSVNPIEDEAVVAAALAGSSGAVRLVPMPSHLDGVDWQPGVKTWRVPHDGGLVDSFEGQDGLSESMFPPRIPVEGLELTRRVLPGDGAGFFLALLEKPAREERVPAAAVDDARQ